VYADALGSYSEFESRNFKSEDGKVRGRFGGKFGKWAYKGGLIEGSVRGEGRAGERDAQVGLHPRGGGGVDQDECRVRFGF
jgi:hypothetical protein